MLSASEQQILMDSSQSVLALVYPKLATRALILLQTLFDKDLAFGAFMGLRTFQQQNALYAQGRTMPGKIVTKARGGESEHNFGLAVDIVEDGDINQAGIQWSWSKNLDYLQIGTAAQQCGLEWGGFWKAFVDYPHVQLSGGLTLADMNKIYSDAGEDIKAVWAEVDRRLAA